MARDVVFSNTRQDQIREAVGILRNATKLSFSGGAGAEQNYFDSVTTFSDMFHHENHLIDSKSGAYTVDTLDSGKIIKVTATAVITLPATVLGLTVTLTCAGSDGTVQITVAPNAADSISGADVTAAYDKDMVNTLATAVKGDFITLFADGSLGWYITGIAGTWAREA